MYRDKKRYGQNPSLISRSKTAFDAPTKWKRSKTVFTCSWSDFFVAEADLWRPDAWEVIRNTPQHTYQILTKRPERVPGHLPKGWPFPNVWLGVSVENERFYSRIRLLQGLPAYIRFLSLEPLLAPMPQLPLDGIAWVVVGGESGPGCRPMKAEWVRQIRDQCHDADTAFFFKQWGGLRKDLTGRVLDGRVWNDIPTQVIARRRRSIPIGN
jgi:protein gp37